MMNTTEKNQKSIREKDKNYERYIKLPKDSSKTLHHHETNQTHHTSDKATSNLDVVRGASEWGHT